MQIEQVPAPMPPGLPPWETLPHQVVLIIALAVVAGTVLLALPLLRALARRIEGRGADPAMRKELDEMRRRLDGMEERSLSSGEVDASVGRLYELEERVDFMERVLSRAKDGDSA